MNPARPETPARPVFDRTTQDIGNIVEFGHVNVRVPDQRLAIIFYVMGLGLTRDPYLVTGVDNAWMNVGTCQFHLPVAQAQVLRGTTGVVMPDLDALMGRLARVVPRLKDTLFSHSRDGDVVNVTCPWGNRIRVHAPDAARFGRIVLGMPYVEIDVAPGTLAGIARFYGDIFAAQVTSGSDAGGAFVRVSTGLNGSLVFRETTRELPPYDGHHIQITVADFSGVHRRLLERGLITEESDASQYRFQDIVDPQTGAVVATLEHEVRSMLHPMYARRYVNRNPDVTNTFYATGHEAAVWHMPPG
jgi:catechol 2,3-dioxygenase-like lactoylglutathione lyase family enzyme